VSVRKDLTISVCHAQVFDALFDLLKRVKRIVIVFYN